MDPLVKSLKELPARFAQLPKMLLVLFGLVLAAAIAGSVVFANAGQDHWQYAFTNLTADDASEIAATLKTANVPFRMEAGGQALAVPAEKVYDARLLLAAAGLPRGGGAGFELFDRGDLGISEFTQKVNLRRALEGELARTIGHLSNVRSARVHLTLAEKGLYRTEDQKAGAAVVVQLQPGRSLDEREVSGIRHLVASAVPGLDAEAVTLVDGRGTALSTESLWGEAEAFRQREMEKSLESRLVTLLEPAVGQGAVVARVSVTLDNTEVQTNKEVVDPQVVLRSEHKMTQSANADSQQGAIQSGLVGAAANTPYVNTNAAGQNVNGSKSNNSSQDESKNYEIGRTVVHSNTKGYRLTKLSVALLVDGADGKARPDEELQQLAELAKRAVGFDPARGDQLEIKSSVFTRSTEPEPAPAKPEGFSLTKSVPPWAVPVGGGALLAVIIVMMLLMMRRKAADSSAAMPQLKSGESVAALEAVLSASPMAQQIAAASPARSADPNISLRDRARELVNKDPSRAALLLRAWLTADEVQHG